MAATIVVVLALTWVGLPGGPTNPLSPRPARAVTLEVVQESVLAGVTRIETLQGRIVVSGSPGPLSPFDTGGGTFSFAVTSEGDFRVSAADGSSDVSFDARVGLHRSVQSVTGTGELRVSEARGMAPGPPDPAPEPSLLHRSLGAFVRAFLAIEADVPVAEAVHEGRRAWRVTVPDPVLGPSSGSSLEAELDVTVDVETGLPLQVVRRFGGHEAGHLRLTQLAMNENVDRSLFQIELPPGRAPSLIEVGFQRGTLSEAESSTSYDLLLPGWVPDGFELAQVAFSPTAAGTGRGNPLSREVVSVAYHRGFDRVILTTRASEGAGERWSDPLGEHGPALSERVVEIDTGPLAGARAALVVDRAGAHLWAVTDEIVVTIVGDMSTDEILSVAKSLERR